MGSEPRFYRLAFPYGRVGRMPLHFLLETSAKIFTGKRMENFGGLQEML